MKQKHRKHRKHRTSLNRLQLLGLAFLGSLLVFGSVHALTLDSSITRSFPILQKLMITQDGDQSSTAIVELSGTNNKLIRLHPSLGNERVLVAPEGIFLRSDKITGGAFSPYSITGSSIATGTITVRNLGFNIYNYIGAGTLTVNDGSCPSGEVIISFTNGNATCAPAGLVSGIPSPLCSNGSFIGRSGIGSPNCLLTGGVLSAANGDYWKQTPSNANDIYYGTGAGGVYSLVTGYVAGTGYSVYASAPIGQYYQGYECPCDSSITSTDAACNVPATYSRPTSQYFFYIGQQSCYDIDTTNNKVTQHSMNISLSGSTYYLNYSPSPNTVGNLPPRCGCDVGTGNECNVPGKQMNLLYPTIPRSPSDGYVWTGSDLGPHCYDISDDVLPNAAKQYTLAKMDKVFDLYSGGYVSGTLIVSGGIVNEKVGVGTDNPLVRLHVSSPSTGPAVISGAVAATPPSYATGSTLYAQVPHTLEQLFTRGSQEPVYQCPCDVDINTEDCGTNGTPPYGTTYYAPATSGYHIGLLRCVDLALNAAPPSGGAPFGRTVTTGATHYPYGAAFMHRLNITFANNIYTMKMGDWQPDGSRYAAEVLPVPPRCECDADDNSADCATAGGQMNSHFPNIAWPSMNYPPLPSGAPYQGYFNMSPLLNSQYANRYYDFVRTSYNGNGSHSVNNRPFSPIFNNPAPYFTGDYIGPNCIDITRANGTNYSMHSGTVGRKLERYRWAASLTGSFLSGSVGSTGTIISTGDIPTLRVDGDGMIQALVDKAVMPGAGTVGALSVHYQGAIFYANGGKIGINTETPQAALDVVGDVRFTNLNNTNYSYLSVDNQGDLFTTGDLNGQSAGLWQIGTKGLYYNGGNVGIGTSGPVVKLHVAGDIIANTNYIVSDETLKENITPLTNAATGIQQFTGVSFSWILDGRSSIGVIAQHVEAVFPDLVKTFNLVDGSERKAVEYYNLIAVAIQAVKEIHTKMLDAGQARLDQQNLELQILEARISALEGGMKRDGTLPE